MARLNAAHRNALSRGEFALPGRRYPIEDTGHAKAALARVSEFGTPHEKAVVREHVARKYPGMKIVSTKK
jgi:hypothetical protein